MCSNLDSLTDSLVPICSSLNLKGEIIGYGCSQGLITVTDSDSGGSSYVQWQCFSSNSTSHCQFKFSSSTICKSSRRRFLSVERNKEEQCRVCCHCEFSSFSYRSFVDFAVMQLMQLQYSNPKKYQPCYSTTAEYLKSSK
jgi:hypothetical protein